MVKYNYLATVKYLDEMKTVMSPSLRKLAKTLDLSVNTVRALLSNKPTCKTGRKISVTRLVV